MGPHDITLALHLRDLDLEHGGHGAASCVTRPFVAFGVFDRVRGVGVVLSIVHRLVPQARDVRENGR